MKKQVKNLAQRRHMTYNQLFRVVFDEYLKNVPEEDLRAVRGRPAKKRRERHAIAEPAATTACGVANAMP